MVEGRKEGEKKEIKMVQVARVEGTIVNDNLTWINLVKPSSDTIEKEIVSRGYHFHELNIEDCLSKRQVAKVDKNTV